MKHWLSNKKNLLKYKNRWLLGSYTFKDLITLKEFKFSYIVETELDFLKYINDDAIINYTYFKFDKDIFLKFINILKKYNKNNKIRVTVFKDTDLSIFSHNSELDYDNISLLNLVKKYDMPLSEYREYDKLLDDIVKPAQNLSVFEKFIYAYNITKLFKEYKEVTNEDEWEKSRNLYKILNNEYIVCTGFSVLLVSLLKKLDIPAESFDFICGNKEYIRKDDNIVIEEDKEEWHSRVLVYLKDNKYGIDGYYISDPTFDNDLFDDLYVFLAFTIFENKSILFDAYSDELEIFDISNLDDYVKFMKKYNLNNLKFLERIEFYDKEFINLLKEKYGSDYNKYENDCNINPMTIDIANYIVSKNNNPISGKIIFKALREIYKLFYGYKNDEQIDEVLENVRQKNMDEYTYKFPRCENNGTYTVNDKNKFDFKCLRKNLKKLILLNYLEVFFYKKIMLTNQHYLL